MKHEPGLSVRVGAGAIVLVAAAGLVSCKRTLHTTVISEKIGLSVRQAPSPPGFDECVERFSCGTPTLGCSKVDVEVLEQDGYAGVARVRATKGAQPDDPVCEQVMEFEIVPTDPPAGHRARGSASMDPAYWKVAKLARK